MQPTLITGPAETATPCAPGGLFLWSQSTRGGPLLTPKPSHLSVKHSHFQQWKIADVSRVASANRSHFPQNPIPASRTGVSQETVWPEQDDSFSLEQHHWKPTTAFPTPPQEKGCRHGSKETAGKIPRGGCDSMPLSKRGLQSSRAHHHVLGCLPSEFGAIQGPNTPLSWSLPALPNPQLPCSSLPPTISTE